MTAAQLSNIKAFAVFPAATLATNYGKTLSDAKIAADLKLIVKYHRVQESSETSTASLPGAGCVDLGRDQTATVGGITYLESFKFEDMNGAAKQLCGANEAERMDQIFTVMFSDGSMILNESAVGASSTYYSTGKTTMVLSTTPYTTSAIGSVNYTVTSPDVFHMYLNENMSSSQTSQTADAVYTGTYIVWFQKGAYKCVVPLDNSETYTCDLMQNSVKVGTYSVDDMHVLTVTDAAGAIVL